MRRLRSVIGGVTANTAGLAALQATTAGTPLTLVTSAMPTPAAGQIHNTALPVTLTSGAGGGSPGNFTVVGTDRRGNPLQEIIAGPAGATTTVSGHMLFNTVTSITPAATSANTLSAGWAGNNYGPWLVTAAHPSAVIAHILSGTPTYAVYATTFDMLDPTFFLPQGAGGTPSSDAQGGQGGGSVSSGPYVTGANWPLVPASLQAAAPQLLSTSLILPEEDGTWTAAIIAPTTFTSAAAGAVGTADEIRLDPTTGFAWRLVNTSTTGLIQLDVNIERPW